MGKEGRAAGEVYRKLQREIKLLGNCMQVSEWVGEGDCDEGGREFGSKSTLYVYTSALARTLPPCEEGGG